MTKKTWSYCDGIPTNIKIYLSNEELTRVEYCEYLGQDLAIDFPSGPNFSHYFPEG